MGNAEELNILEFHGINIPEKDNQTLGDKIAKLFNTQEFSCQEIANQLDISLNTTKSIVKTLQNDDVLGRKDRSGRIISPPKNKESLKKFPYKQYTSKEYAIKNLDEKDKQVLELYPTHSRLEISKLLQLSPQIITTKIQKLVRNNIVQRKVNRQNKKTKTWEDYIPKETAKLESLPLKQKDNISVKHLELLIEILHREEDKNHRKMLIELFYENTYNY